MTGLDFLGAIAVFPDGTLRVANLDGSFVGAVLRYGPNGSPQGTLVGGLSGAFGVAVDGTGQVLVSGGFTEDFSSSTVLAAAPGGGIAERARGFAFSSDLFHDPQRDETLVLDFGVTEVTVLCRDTDADTVCDCPRAAGPKLKVGGLLEVPGQQSVLLKGEVAVPAAPALDPVTTGVRVTIDGADGPLLEATIPGGAFDPDTGLGWQEKNGKYKWRNPSGVAGVTKVVIATSGTAPELVTVTARGKSASLAVGPGDLPLRARVALATGDGQCGDFRFPGPDPACTLNVAKGKVACK